MAKVQSWNQFLSHWQRKQTSYCGLPWCNIIPKVRVQEKKNKNKVYMVKSQTSNTFIAHSWQTSTKWDGPMGGLRGWPSGPQPPLCLWNFVSFFYIALEVSELPLSEFSGSTPGTTFVAWWHYCKHQGEYTCYHYGISVINALPSLLQNVPSGLEWGETAAFAGLFLVCKTAAFSVITQRFSPQMAAENRTTFLSRS